MRLLPLLSAATDPAAWPGHRDVDLRLDAPLHPGWGGWLRQGGAIHALHLAERPFDEALVETCAEALGQRLGSDFLVLRARHPVGRGPVSRFLHALQGLLEATYPRGVKLALRPAPGSAGPLVALLKEVRGEAVGFCWEASVGADLEAISDRLFCAVGAPGDDLAGLQTLGYRWNLALPEADPVAFQSAKEALLAAFPPVLFPAALPTHALGRPVLPEPGLSFGKAWGQER